MKLDRLQQIAAEAYSFEKKGWDLLPACNKAINAEKHSARGPLKPSDRARVLRYVVGREPASEVLSG